MSFYRKPHEEYLLALDEKKELNSIGHYLMDHLKIAGSYWCITALEAMKINVDNKKKEQIIAFFVNAQNADGGFGGNINHDSHITSTHYSILVLGQWGCLNRINTDDVINYVRGLQTEEGSFMGDAYGEIDTRFSYCG